MTAFTPEEAWLIARLAAVDTMPIPEGDLPALHRHVRRARRWTQLSAAAIALLVLGTAATAFGSRSDDHVRAAGEPVPTTTTTAAAPPTTSTTLVEDQAPPPDGMIAVADGLGRRVGFMPNPAGMLECDPLPLGTDGQEVCGVAVVDRQGDQTGWSLAGLGFVSLAQASDPAFIDALVQADREGRAIDAEGLAEERTGD